MDRINIIAEKNYIHYPYLLSTISFRKKIWTHVTKILLDECLSRSANGEECRLINFPPDSRRNQRGRCNKTWTTDLRGWEAGSGIVNMYSIPRRI